ncbi:hypothetical protein CRENBAI_011597 [Crenichthys baileyi]|uniref:Uncharacterized protein n=1 Tax=Crenichthys baileyi TaxID=28760 RepID=A0AAV9SDZ0_9TELE
MPAETTAFGEFSRRQLLEQSEPDLGAAPPACCCCCCRSCYCWMTSEESGLGSERCRTLAPLPSLSTSLSCPRLYNNSNYWNSTAERDLRRGYSHQRTPYCSDPGGETSVDCCKA